MKSHTSYLVFILLAYFLSNCSKIKTFEGVWIPRDDQLKASTEMKLVIEKVNDSTYDIQMFFKESKENRTNLSVSGTYLYNKKMDQIKNTSSNVVMEITNDGELYTQGLIGVQFFTRK